MMSFVLLAIALCAVANAQNIRERGAIGGLAFFDADGNNSEYDGMTWDTGVPAVSIELQNASGETLATTKTNKQGRYSFKNLDWGDYRLAVDAPKGYSFVQPNSGHSGADSDVGLNGVSDLISISSKLTAGTMYHTDIGLRSSGLRSSGIANPRWSNQNVWNGMVPGPQDIVHVRRGMTLVLDQDITIKGLIITGEFAVEDKTDIELSADWILVLNGGKFEVGTAQTPFKNKFTLTLEGDDLNLDVDLKEMKSCIEPAFGATSTCRNGSCVCGETNDQVVLKKNNAFLMAMGEGSRIEMFSDDAKKKSWSKLSETVKKGEKVLEFSEQTGWEAGDRIAIASSGFDMNEAEEFVVLKSLNGGRTITLDGTLAFPHYGQIEKYNNNKRGSAYREWSLDMRAEVALLSRRVKVQGGADSASRRKGGHMIATMGAELFISGVEFFSMGQEGVLGRYPAHWHMLGDAHGQFIQNSSFHHTYNKGITIHGTQNVRLKDNVVYETIGHGYFLEDGSEFHNVLLGNLGFSTRASSSIDVAAHDSDFLAVSTFWIENPNNRFINNHAAGSQNAGFWIATRKSVRGASKDSGLYDDLNPSTEPFGIFRGNSIHSSHDRGFAGGGASNIGAVDMRQSGDALVEDLTIYKILKNGIYLFGKHVDFRGLMVCEQGRDRAFGSHHFIDSLYVGRSGNNFDSHKRKRAEGWASYDGPNGLINVHFENFMGNDFAIASGFAVRMSGQDFFRGISFGETVNFENRISLDRGIPRRTFGTISTVLHDLDGSLTGYKGASIMPDFGEGQRINVGGEFVVKPEWSAVIELPEQKVEHALLQVVVDGDDQVFVPISRSDGQSCLPGAGQMDIPMITSGETSYTLDYSKKNPSQMNFALQFAESGSSVLLNLIGMKTVSKSSGNMRQASGWEDLKKSEASSFFVVNGSAWVKIVAGNERMDDAPRSGNADNMANAYSAKVWIRA